VAPEHESAPSPARATAAPTSARAPARDLDAVAEVLTLQRTAGNTAVGTLLGRGAGPGVLRDPTAGWAGVTSGPNAAPHTTAGTAIKRVPVKGIAEGRGKGNALVLIPEWLPAVATVEVLFHLHGHKTGSFAAGYPGAEDESLYRFEQALDQFSAAKTRPIIAILPQGGDTSEFGKSASEVNAGTYIQQAIDAVPPDQWPHKPAPKAGGIILSGHSGAGGRFASMFGNEKMPGGTGAGHLEGFFSFDTVNGKDGQRVSQIVEGNEYKKHLAFVLGRLDEDLTMLQAERAKLGAKKEDDIQAALEAKLQKDGFRFRAFYSGSPHLKAAKPGETPALDPDAEAGYADRYFLLKGKVDEWFDAHAGDLGGKGSKAFAALRANYTIEAAGTDHMHDMGGVPGTGGAWDHENMRRALGSLPTSPQGGP
jgi:hypothetical protein